MERLSLRLVGPGDRAFQQYIPGNLRSLLGRDDTVCVGAVYEAASCGAALAQREQWGDSYELRYIFVDPRARLCGLGTYLLRGLLGQLRARGAREVRAVYSAGMLENGGQRLGILERAGFPVVENAALEHEADVMGQRVSSGLTAQAGPQNGWGGEPMAISPMSESAAPAQCKIGRNKKNKDAAPGPQQGTGGAVQAAKVSTHSLSDEEERALQEGMLHAPGIWDSGSEGDFDDLHDSLEADDKTDEIAHYIVPTDEEMDGLSAPAPKKHWWQRRR